MVHGTWTKKLNVDHSSKGQGNDIENFQLIYKKQNYKKQNSTFSLIVFCKIMSTFLSAAELFVFKSKIFLQVCYLKKGICFEFYSRWFSVGRFDYNGA